MNEEMRSPRLLTVAAGLFIALGALALVDLAIRFVQHQTYLNGTIIDLFIGIGLLYHRRVWRTIALFTCALSLFVLGWLAWFVIGGRASATIALFGIPVGASPLLYVALVLMAAIPAFQLWVLTRPEVTRVFTAHS